MLLEKDENGGCCYGLEKDDIIWQLIYNKMIQASWFGEEK